MWEWRRYSIQFLLHKFEYHLQSRRRWRKVQLQLKWRIEAAQVLWSLISRFVQVFEVQSSASKVWKFEKPEPISPHEWMPAIFLCLMCRLWKQRIVKHQLATTAAPNPPESRTGGTPSLTPNRGWEHWRRTWHPTSMKGLASKHFFKLNVLITFVFCVN